MDPTTLSDAYKFSILLHVERFETDHETANKLRDYVTEIVKKEESKTTKKEIDKVYFDIHSEKPDLEIYSLSSHSAFFEEHMLSVKKANDEAIVKKVKHAFDELLSFIVEGSLYLPLNSIENLVKFQKVVLQYNGKQTAFSNGVLGEKLHCTLVFCHKRS